MIRRLILLITFALLVSVGLTPAEAQSRRQVYAYYFGWHTGGSWNDARLIDRPAASYSSLDAGVVGRQITEAQSVGIDAFILAWYGPKDNNLTHQSLNILLDQSARRSFKTGVAVDLGSGSFNASVQDTIETMQHLIQNRVSHPAYVRYGGKPVIYFWNQGRFPIGEWQYIRSIIDPAHYTIWVMQGTDTSYLSVFDGLYLFNVAWSQDFASTAAGWRANTYEAGGTFYSATAMPGWNESNIAGRANPTAPQARDGGNFLSASFAGAAHSDTDTILIVSWNEYLENSHIEPSQAYGSQALDTLRPLVSAWKADGAVAAAPPAPVQPQPGGIPPTQAQPPTPIEPTQVEYPPTQAQPPTPQAPAPAGLAYRLFFNVRLREAPRADAPTITSIPVETTIRVIGRTSDRAWAQVEYEGATGWVSAEYGTFIGGNLSDAPITG